MKIFFSWSGDRSKRLAEVFKKWIPAVLQAARPYFSPADIEKGTRWANEIAKELEASKYGLIFLTSENLDAAWIMFEAGALSKSIDKSRVTPLLFGLEPADIKGPLVQFQAAPFARDHVLACVKGINAGLDSPLAAEVLDLVFKKWWPDLEKEVAEIMAEAPKTEKHDKKKIRDDRELLEEVVELSRALLGKVNTSSPGTARSRVNPHAIADAATEFSALVVSMDLESISDEVRVHLRQLQAPLRYLVDNVAGIPDSERTEIVAGLKKAVGAIRGSTQNATTTASPDEIPF